MTDRRAERDQGHPSAEEVRLIDLLHRASSTMPPSPRSVIDVSIEDGIRRTRRQRLRHLVAAAATAAVIGSAATLATTNMGDAHDGGTPTAEDVADEFGVEPAGMGEKLVDLLAQSVLPAHPDGVRIDSGASPRWVARSAAELRYPTKEIAPHVSDTRAGAVSYWKGGERVDVAVIVQRLRNPKADPSAVQQAVATSDFSGAFSKTASGLLYLQGKDDSAGPGSSAAATLIADSGWIVRAMSRNPSSVSVDVLALLALNEAWLP
ncbi:hypothetical protein [Nocardioides sp. W7]|uniref:hypothetical protein n=1 Tax=Nocardioides sp. W7 TaxID=2931390 RepID=UPI001FD42506|nr:hypothetical protein [Nocardioides sp. W7]